MNEKEAVKQAELLTLEDFLVALRRRWYWFVVSLALALVGAWLYIKYTPKVYTRSASILIKEEAKGKGLTGDVASAFMDMGLVSGNVNVNNELLTMQSPMHLTEAVRRLDLQTTYNAPGKYHREVLYGSNLPVVLRFEELPETAAAGFRMDIAAGGMVSLSEFSQWGEELSHPAIRVKVGEVARTPLGRVRVLENPRGKMRLVEDILVRRDPLYQAVEAYTRALMVDLTDEKSSVLNLTLNDNSIERADDFLNTLIEVYREKHIQEKNDAARQASMFIDERLKVISGELGTVDKSITQFKSKTLVPDIEEASRLFMGQMSEISTQITALRSQAYMARHIRNLLQNLDKTKLLPVNGNAQNPALEVQIREFNELLMRRSNYIASSGERSPLVQDIDNSLEQLKPAIITSLNNQLLAVETQLSALEQSQRQTTSRVATTPEQANFLLGEGRQQKIKEALYLFLLQKREENDLTQAFTSSNTRVISAPTGSLRATYPQKRNVLVLALFFGLALPALIIYLKVVLNNKIQSRKDIEGLSIPFLGELPEVLGERNRLGRRQKFDEENPILVVENGRDVINEAFRSVRTSLEFILGGQDACRVVMTTSIVPSSGKTFITSNLAKSFALKGKRVLVVDLDIRRARSSKMIGSPHIGIANYLAGQTNQISDILHRKVFDGCVDLIPVGTIPPNPTELLAGASLGELITSLRGQYDLIFLDCPPVEIVADVDIVKELADATIFVVRAHTIDKTALTHIEEYYTSQRFKGMTLLLNGTSDYQRRYGYGNYSYSYNIEY